MKKTIKYAARVLLIALLAAFVFFFVGGNKPREDVLWGANFSHAHAKELGLNWQETYLALLDDLKVKRLKVITQWNLLEPEKDRFDFEAIDWQIKEAEERGVKVFLTLGMKTPRFPECHLPDWAVNLSEKDREEAVLELLRASVEHFKDSPAIWAWQVENEPLFPFGECPEISKDFWRKEIDLVKTLDPTRPIIATDSGELSLWFNAARLGDIVGVTLYRKIWFKELGTYASYPLPPIFYGRKAQLVKTIFGKEVINVELQAEPWGPTLLYDSPPEEQVKTMNPERFKETVNYAKKTGLGEFYFWGAEWWYSLKLKGEEEIWREAGGLF